MQILSQFVYTLYIRHLSAQNYKINFKIKFLLKTVSRARTRLSFSMLLKVTQKNISFTEQKILDGKEMSEIINDTRFETEFVSAEDPSHMP